MPFWLRIANVTAASYRAPGYQGASLTDVGCTYRTFWKSSYEAIKHNLLGAGAGALPEMMIEFIRNDMRVMKSR